MYCALFGAQYVALSFYSLSVSRMRAGLPPPPRRRPVDTPFDKCNYAKLLAGIAPQSKL
jgi:hypothetical protein